ncbi:hypothetical protein RH858_05050 [Halalkaliarchaeum sp. AArc-GB]|uniref:DUF7344 domain-containing protein n=1 Tax=Halalkaliarchaeum sp. AArc-GB TaxID=3074078 RepID=UPI00285AE60C|nr:hypothetical protein [Halalkaliarchaeum sp. AArc-GB]MDR5672517.1 hypothetical protein [Halalkaliarchaeum sp. AArc-GB]
MGISNDTISSTVDSLVPSSRNRDPAISREEIFEVLSNERRRLALQYLEQADEEPVPLREVVDYVTSRQNGASLEEIDSATRKAVYTALRQSHFPKMDDMGVVEYDQLRGEIELTDTANEVQMYLEYVPKNDIPWHEYYLGLAGVCAALVTVTWAGIYPFGGLSWQLLSLLFVLLFVISAVSHAYHARGNRLENATVTEEGQ